MKRRNSMLFWKSLFSRDFTDWIFKRNKKVIRIKIVRYFLAGNPENYGWGCNTILKDIISYFSDSDRIFVRKQIESTFRGMLKEGRLKYYAWTIRLAPANELEEAILDKYYISLSGDRILAFQKSLNNLALSAAQVGKSISSLKIPNIRNG